MKMTNVMYLPTLVMNEYWGFLFHEQVADLALLTAEMPKFESRYIDNLVGKCHSKYPAFHCLINCRSQ